MNSHEITLASFLCGTLLGKQTCVGNRALIPCTYAEKGFRTSAPFGHNAIQRFIY